jgi:hypothetical protein
MALAIDAPGGRMEEDVRDVLRWAKGDACDSRAAAYDPDQRDFDGDAIWNACTP